MSTTLGTSSTASVFTPAANEVRNDRPHPKGDDESSIGVGTQHDRQQRHELRVDREGRHRGSANPEPADPTQLARLDGGDLILRRLEHRPAMPFDELDGRLAEGCARTEGQEDPNRGRDAGSHPRGSAVHAGLPERREQERPDDGVDDCQQRERGGRADQRDDEEGQQERRGNRAARCW